MTGKGSNRVFVFLACALAASVGLLAGFSGAAEPLAGRTTPVAGSSWRATELERTVAAPVRLPVVLSYIPRWQGADWVAPPERQPLQPSYFAPVAGEDFRPYEPLPELELDLSPAKGGKTTVGGWIEVGYHSGRLGQ